LGTVNSELFVNETTDYDKFTMISEDFFEGTALTMSIDCENPTDCNNVIMFQDRVQKMGGSLGVPNLDIKDIEADKHKVLV